jgi:hypothetical protein
MINGKMVIFRIAARVCLDTDGHLAKLIDTIKEVGQSADIQLSNDDAQLIVEKFAPTAGQLESVRFIERNLGIRCRKVDRFLVGEFIKMHKAKSMEKQS